MELKKLFAEHEKPTHCCKGDVHAQIGPILALGAAVQKQMIEYRQALMDELLEDDSQASKVEIFHQTFGAAERQAAEFVQAGRQLALTFTQLDRYVADDKKRRELQLEIGDGAHPKSLPTGARNT